MPSAANEAAAWSSGELDRIGRAQELQLASRRKDGTLRPYVTMWVVRAGDEVYVRSAYGPDNPWYRRATASGTGRIRAGGIEADVTFAQADDGAQGDIDAAYHAKYDRYGPRIVGSVTGDNAHKVTIRLVPAAGQNQALNQPQRGTTVQTVTLNNGVEMPILGFGVYQIPAQETEKAVSEALAVGYRHLDTAAAYRNEEAVGRAITASSIPRDQLFVTTKLWIQDAPVEDNTKRAFETSLQRLGLDYLDLYLIHQPFGDYYSSWRAMQDLHREGRARAIGAANFYPDRLIDLIDHNEITPAVNQIETHPFFQRQDYQELMRQRGVQIESWGPFAEGRNNLFTDPTLTAIANAQGKSVAQVVLRWLIQRNVVVIPKTVRPERMAENLDVFDFALTGDDMARIAALDTGASLFFAHWDPGMVSQLGNARVD